MTTPGDVARALSSARRVLVCSHVPPDGDGLGAGIALVRAMRSTGREAVFAAGGPLPSNLRFVAREDEIDAAPEGPRGPFDAAVALDAADAARLGALLARCAACPVFVNIDHHATNDGYGTLAWVDPGSPAVGEMVYRLLPALGAALDADIGLPLYVAVVTDTGRFGYSNTTPATHRMAADLLAAGVDPALVTDRVYRSLPPAWLRLAALALADLRLEADGLVAHVSVTEEMLAATGADPLDAGDVVDFPIAAAGVEVGVLFRPAAGGRGTKVSLRSRRYFPVHTFAARYGGGGHARAAGAVLPRPLGPARAEILAALLPEVEALARARGERR